MSRFPIGFWNYTTGQLTAKDVKDWVDLGMTMANSPEITDETDLDVIRGMMDACEENDIKMILCDRRLYWHGAADHPEEYRAKFRASYEASESIPPPSAFISATSPPASRPSPTATPPTASRGRSPPS